MATSFQSRRLDVTFTLVSGAFADGKSDTVKLTKLRIHADIHMAGGYQLADGKFRIYGLGQDLMNRLTILNWQALGSMSLNRNTIRLEAGTNDDDMATVFFGDIYNAMGDYQGTPDVPFIVDAKSGMVDKLKSAKANSFPGAQPVSRIMSRLAGQLGASFEDNGVKATITDQVLSGTVIEQIQTLARNANIDYYYEPPVLAICNKGQPRKGEIPFINPESGLVGWPTIDRQGVAFTILYNPSVRHGGKIKLETSVKPANGEFFIYSMSHVLSSESPGGPWFTHVLATEQQNAVRL